MSDTNKISIEYSKDLQVLIETAFNDFRQYLKDKVQNDLLVEQARIKANKEKFDAALKMINKNGAVDKLIVQAANKLMGEPVISPKINTPGKTDSKSTRAEKPKLIPLIIQLNEHLDLDSDFRRSLDSVIKKTSVHELICNLLKCTSEDDALIILNRIRLNLLVEDMPYLIHLNNALTSKEKELVGKIVNFDFC